MIDRFRGEGYEVVPRGAVLFRHYNDSLGGYIHDDCILMSTSRAFHEKVLRAQYEENLRKHPDTPTAQIRTEHGVVMTKQTLSSADDPRGSQQSMNQIVEKQIEHVS